MRTWDLVLPVERVANGAGGEAMFLQIARAISEHIRRGRLRPGEPIPGTRSLARSLGVHRNTVLAAMRELTAEGWLTTSPARGTFVSSALPDPSPRSFVAEVKTPARTPSRAGYPLREPPRPWISSHTGPGTAALVGGKPDVGLVPVLSLARAYRRTLRRHGATVLSYGDGRGHLRLRAAVASMLTATRGVPATADEVVITRGSQMALYLTARTLIAAGDVVAVESLGYPPAWEGLRAAGARLVPLPLDAEGVNVDALEAITKRERVRAVYLTPHHQYPTTVSLSAGRRIRLLELARKKKMAIIEDDYDHEFHYEGRPILPLASVDRAGVVVYLGTLSKVLAPGLRIGYVVAPVAVVEHLAAHRSFIDVHGDQAVECAIAELFEEGEVQRHVRRARRVYFGRRDALVTALRKHMPDDLTFDVPSGGMAMWCRVTRKRVNVEAWADRAEKAGVKFHPGRPFSFDGKAIPYVRLGFASVAEKAMDAAVRVMAETIGG